MAIGIFDPSITPDGVFDPAATPDGVFDADLIQTVSAGTPTVVKQLSALGVG